MRKKKIRAIRADQLVSLDVTQLGGLTHEIIDLVY